MKYSSRHGVRSGIVFGLFFGLFQAGIHADALQGVAFGALGGVLFGLAIAWLLRRKERVWAAMRAPYESEGIAQHGPSMCSIGQGYLVLTNKRLVWIPTVERDRHKLISIARDAITKATRISSFQRNLRIEVSTGETVDFLVRDRDEWMTQLRGLLPSARVV